MSIRQLLQKLNSIPRNMLTDYEKIFILDMSIKAKIFKYFKGEQETKALEILRKYTGDV